jgi:hypothetical protein
MMKTKAMAVHAQGTPRTIRATRTDLSTAWTAEVDAARAARAAGDQDGEWRHLERAHILSQPMAWPHVRTHLAMFGAGIRRRDRREVLGQLARIMLAAPGSWSGKYPSGNTGGASVSAFRPMPIPEDLRAILDNAASVTR